jgi:copper homeostasis protein
MKAMPNQPILLEVAVFSIEAAIAAIQAGADRIEFCENPNEGGTTPSYGSLKTLIALSQKPIFPIIRPRGGDFLYTDAEFDCIKTDLLMVKELGYPGAVIGMLNADGSIDVARTKALVALAAPMEITFHRAFDRCNDPMQGLEDIIQTGCKRILTSGQMPNVGDAISLVKQLVQKADGRIIILPGSGVRSNNCKEIIEQTGAIEIHSSARKAIPSKMQYNAPTMNENMVSMGVDELEIKNMLAALV